MSGRGLEAELPRFANADRTRIFTNAWTWAEGAEPVDDATGQIDAVSVDQVAEMAGPGMSFATSLAKLRPTKVIGLIPCAKGGSSILQWKRNTSRESLYGSMIARAKAAQAQGVLKGLVWYQGEAESAGADTAAAQNWRQSFLTLAQDVCDDLKAPDLKFVVTELAPNPKPEAYLNWAMIQQQQRSLSGARNGNVACVSAADLAGKPKDPIHLDTASAVILGQRYAAAMDKLLSNIPAGS